MEFNKYDLFAYQILHYLVTKQHYQIVRIQQHKEDIWLMNANQAKYPVIRISSMENAGALTDTSYIRNVHQVILKLIHREGPIMIINTHPGSTPIDNMVLTQICITPKGVSDQQILNTFHGIDQVVHESEDMQEEIAVLTRTIEETELLHQKATVAKTKPKNRPIVTYVWIGLCILFTLAAFMFSLYIKDQRVGMIAFGAYYKMNVVAAHEYWRLFTAGFLHHDPLNLLLNVYAFYLIGKACERNYHKTQFLCILIVSIFVGNMCMLIGNANAIAVGVSGGVFGLIGAHLVVLVENHTIRYPIMRFSLFKIVWMAVLIAFLPGVSFLSIIGGFLSGILLGIIFVPSDRWQELKKHTKISGLLLTIILCYCSVQISVVEPIARDVDKKVIDVYRNTLLNKYADYLQNCYQKQYRLE